MAEVSPEKSSRSLLPSYREEFRGKVQRRVSKGWKEKGCPPASRPAPLLQALWDQERWGEVTARVVGSPIPGAAGVFLLAPRRCCLHYAFHRKGRSVPVGRVWGLFHMSLE